MSKKFTSIIFFIVAQSTYGSFIESTMGAAVVNDATATYYNPAALVLLKNSQIIGMGSVARSNSTFTGTVTQVRTQFSQNGRSNDASKYNLPAFYLAFPLDSFRLGFAVISNFFNSDLEDRSILRYAKPSNNVSNIDLITSAGYKINEKFSIGAGVNFSRATFITHPITGFPSLNIPDSQSRNDTDAHNVGGFAGFLIRPDQFTLIGFNYRSSIRFPFKGTSTLSGPITLISKNYHFDFWTPARSVLSMSRAVNQKVSVITTVQYIQWDIFKNINIYGIATQAGNRAIIANAQVPYRLKNSWILTFGNQYKLNPQWIIRLATAYVQSPSNGHFQISSGDSVILGGSMGYDINNYISVDGSYAHAFIKNEDINIINNRNRIVGVNNNVRDSVSLKLTLNV